MASTVTQFPPPTYSSSYFLRNVIKEFLSKRLSNGSNEKKTNATAAICEDAATGDKGLDVSDLWKSRPSPSAGNKNEAVAPVSTFKRWRRGGRSSPSHVQNFGGGKEPPGEGDRSLLKFLALNALDLTAPASDIILKNRQNSWFQLSGHPDCFAPAGPGTIWKKRSGGPENAEREVYEALGSDPAMKDIVPRYFREVEYKGEKFIELQDLLHGFSDPHVMDVKMGTRTFLESEVQKTTARPDLYQKMVAVDPSAPSFEEHRDKAVTKLRYMQFREQQSSTCSQGFRVEALKFRGSPPVTDLKKVKSREEVMVTMALFLGGQEDTRQRLLARLKEIREKFEQSSYFQRHEVVGSSIFMIYDDTKVGAWIIDFAKTLPVPEGTVVNHRRQWVQGNHEEGFLTGLDSLISIMEEVDLNSSPASYKSPLVRTDSKSSSLKS
ncbi:inositol-trisphosphate 3-kinase homolog isoform X2 [Cryptotermes secundus]|uniref:inositol-trisphosphate 3-kinase homolog isoform X2 n=1 Tax=Cryptotermes secundus TaxID=105785 RepID=UPI000CD7B9A8|nr:inositol-trisphosphate 3-kinase homolog isoform X2 [Cryptotermes secundus]